MVSSILTHAVVLCFPNVGAVSGLTLLVDSKDRRSTISLYIFVRMLDVVGRHLTSTGVLPAWEYSSEFLFALSNSAIMYAFIIQPQLLPKVRLVFVFSASASSPGL